MEQKVAVVQHCFFIPHVQRVRAITVWRNNSNPRHPGLRGGDEPNHPCAGSIAAVYLPGAQGFIVKDLGNDLPASIKFDERETVVEFPRRDHTLEMHPGRNRSGELDTDDTT